MGKRQKQKHLHVVVSYQKSRVDYSLLYEISFCEEIAKAISKLLLILLPSYIIDLL